MVRKSRSYFLIKDRKSTSQSSTLPPSLHFPCSRRDRQECFPCSETPPVQIEEHCCGPAKIILRGSSQARLFLVDDIFRGGVGISTTAKTSLINDILRSSVGISSFVDDVLRGSIRIGPLVYDILGGSIRISTASKSWNCIFVISQSDGQQEDIGSRILIVGAAAPRAARAGRSHISVD